MELTRPLIKENQASNVERFVTSLEIIHVHLSLFIFVSDICLHSESRINVSLIVHYVIQDDTILHVMGDRYVVPPIIFTSNDNYVAAVGVLISNKMYRLRIKKRPTTHHNGVPCLAFLLPQLDYINIDHIMEYQMPKIFVMDGSIV
jgi:hypothetical protein